MNSYQHALFSQNNADTVKQDHLLNIWDKRRIQTGNSYTTTEIQNVAP